RKAMLQDIAVLTGAQVVTSDLGLDLKTVGTEVLGRAGRVVITKDSTTIVGGAGDDQAVSDRVAQIRAEIENTDSDWDREKLQEKKMRIEDAVSATRAAIEEGIVAGGGSAIVQASSVLEGDLGLEGDEAVGVRAVAAAVVEPLRWIAENAGHEGYVVVEKVKEAQTGTGLNAATGDYVDLVSAGIMDPVKVTRSALRNAASIAGMVLTTETLVIEKQDDED